MPENTLYSLKSPAEIKRRMAMLDQPHIARLTAFLAEAKINLEKETGKNLDMPFFDPCGAGMAARVLFILESPGPKSSQNKGSGFLSCNNPDPTARNMFGLLETSGISRREVLFWNIVPWYLGDERKGAPVYRSDIVQALPYHRRLINLLPDLEVIVFVGNKARSAIPELRKITHLPFVETYHMGLRVWNDPVKQARIKTDFLKISALLNGAAISTPQQTVGAPAQQATNSEKEVHYWITTHWPSSEPEDSPVYRHVYIKRNRSNIPKPNDVIFIYESKYAVVNGEVKTETVLRHEGATTMEHVPQGRSAVISVAIVAGQPRSFHASDKVRDYGDLEDWMVVPCKHQRKTQLLSKEDLMEILGYPRKTPPRFLNLYRIKDVNRVIELAKRLKAPS